MVSSISSSSMGYSPLPTSEFLTLESIKYYEKSINSYLLELSNFYKTHGRYDMSLLSRLEIELNIIKTKRPSNSIHFPQIDSFINEIDKIILIIDRNKEFSCSSPLSLNTGLGSISFTKMFLLPLKIPTSSSTDSSSTLTTAPVPPHHHQYSYQPAPIPSSTYSSASSTTVPVPSYHHQYPSYQPAPIPSSTYSSASSTTAPVPSYHHQYPSYQPAPIPSSTYSSASSTTAPVPSYHHQYPSYQPAPIPSSTYSSLSSTTAPVPPHHHQYSYQPAPIPSSTYSSPSPTTASVPPHHHQYSYQPAPIPSSTYSSPSSTTASIPPHHHQYSYQPAPIPSSTYSSASSTMAPVPPHHHQYSYQPAPIPSSTYSSASSTTAPVPPHHHQYPSYQPAPIPSSTYSSPSPTTASVPPHHHQYSYQPAPIPSSTYSSPSSTTASVPPHHHQYPSYQPAPIPSSTYSSASSTTAPVPPHHHQYPSYQPAPIPSSTYSSASSTTAPVPPHHHQYPSYQPAPIPSYSSASSTTGSVPPHHHQYSSYQVASNTPSLPSHPFMAALSTPAITVSSSTVASISHNSSSTSTLSFVPSAVRQIVRESPGSSIAISYTSVSGVSKSGISAILVTDEQGRAYKMNHGERFKDFNTRLKHVLGEGTLFINEYSIESHRNFKVLLDDITEMYEAILLVELSKVDHKISYKRANRLTPQVINPTLPASISRPMPRVASDEVAIPSHFGQITFLHSGSSSSSISALGQSVIPSIHQAVIPALEYPGVGASLMDPIEGKEASSSATSISGGGRFSVDPNFIVMKQIIMAAKPVRDFGDYSDEGLRLLQEEAVHEIVPHLFLGGNYIPEVVHSKYSKLKKQDIPRSCAQIIHVTHKDPKYNATGIEQFKFPNTGCDVDVTSFRADNQSKLREAIKLIHRSVSVGKNVLVNCRQGVDRSVTVVIAYIMSYYSVSVDQAFNFVRGIRYVANPLDVPGSDYMTFLRRDFNLVNLHTES